MKNGACRKRILTRIRTRTNDPERRRVLVAGILVALLILLAPGLTQAQVDGMRISDLDHSDLHKSDRQRALVLELAIRRLGQRISGKELRDLGVLQRLLDAGFIKRTQVYEQQALGLVMGDIMVTQLGLHWVVVDDQVGHSRALRYKDANDLFFPITMISKKLKFDRAADIREAYAIIETKVKRLKEKERPGLGNRSRRPPITASELKAMREANM